ncbi:MAG: hypothetical protein R2745_22440 [Vicinamibacterales bacterium]
MAVAIVGLIVVGLVALAVWAARKHTAMGRAADQALETLARRLGTTFTHGQKTLRGTLDGRACTVEEEVLRTAGGDGDREYIVSIAIATTAGAQLAIGPRLSTTGAPRIGGAPTGDPVLDDALIVDTSDPARLLAALDADDRQRLGAWGQSYWVRRLRIVDGHLRVEANRGLLDAAQVTEVGVLLDVLSRILRGLE